MTAAVLTDPSVKRPARLLAEAVRELLGTAPADLESGQPAGSVNVERAYVSVYELKAADRIVVSCVPLDQTGRLNVRSGPKLTAREIGIEVSVQKRLVNSFQSAAGRDEIDRLGDYSERILRACLQSVSDPDGNTFAPTEDFSSTGQIENVLREWNQFTEIHSLTYSTHA
jgi:hypothetical protein